ncbi:LysM peptidoglycan-binding domain-containing protein [Pseudarthrobacter sp. alpha12b]
MRYSGKREWSDAAMALALLVLGSFLCILGAGLLEQWQVSADRHQDSSVEILLAFAATAAGIGLLLWWAFSILCAGASVLLERLGRHQAAAAARRLSPAFMQRTVVAALSIQLLAGAAANAATTTPGPEWTPTQAHSSAASSSPATAEDTPTPGHTDSPGVHTPVQRVTAEVPPAVQEGESPAWEPSAATPTATALNPGWQPASPVVEPGMLAAPAMRSTAGPEPGAPTTGGEADVVTVLAGDTLWDIVAAYLGPEASDVDIALEWPRWYAANRGLIGGNPDVLLPGQILQAPAAP